MPRIAVPRYPVHPLFVFILPFTFSTLILFFLSLPPYHFLPSPQEKCPVHRTDIRKTGQIFFSVYFIALTIALNSSLAANPFTTSSRLAPLSSICTHPARPSASASRSKYSLYRIRMKSSCPGSFSRNSVEKIISYRFHSIRHPHRHLSYC